jgi:hypothetical protein
MPAAPGLPSSQYALVAIAPSAGERLGRRPVRRAASFLAHLIATAGHQPQTRQHRRADAAEVIAAYQATIAKLQRLDSQ